MKMQSWRKESSLSKDLQRNAATGIFDRNDLCEINLLHESPVLGKPQLNHFSSQQYLILVASVVDCPTNRFLGTIKPDERVA